MSSKDHSITPLKEELNDMTLSTPAKEKKEVTNSTIEEPDSESPRTFNYEIRRLNSQTIRIEGIKPIEHIIKPLQSDMKKVQASEALSQATLKKRKLENMVDDDLSILREERIVNMKVKQDDTRKIYRRISYTRDFKERAINGAKIFGLKMVADKLNLNENMLRKWIKSGAIRKTGSGRKPGFPEVEDKLYRWIVAKRDNFQPISIKMAQKKALKIAIQLGINKQENPDEINTQEESKNFRQAGDG
jgi:transposase-like protein